MSRFETANRYEEFANTGQAAERGLAEPLAPWQSMTAANKAAPPVWSQGLFSDCCTGECSVVVCPSSHRSFVLTVHGAGVEVARARDVERPTPARQLGPGKGVKVEHEKVVHAPHA